MEFISKKLDDYCKEHTSSACDVLEELNRETHTSVLNPRMISGNLQGQFLTMLSRMMRPKCILEIGTYTGYSAICLAKGLPVDGVLHTIDVNEELEEMNTRYFKKAGFEHQIVQHIGDASKLIPDLDLTVEMAFIDADKKNYPLYFNLLIDKMKPGGWIIADNVLWSGKVIEQVNSSDKATLALLEYNRMVQNDPRVENLLLPLRDGLMICRKKE
ncbi:O-methyltransferase [Flavobacteriales bacterium]|jgi:caffeoyl-CoA O-methyltransferase|nr:O-methyltransferase [Flavobacteriales bacterium]